MHRTVVDRRAFPSLSRSSYAESLASLHGGKSQEQFMSVSAGTEADQAVCSWSESRRVTARSMQRAHALLWKWITTIAEKHIEEPTLSATQLIRKYSTLAPSKSERNWVPLIYAERRMVCHFKL